MITHLQVFDSFIQQNLPLFTSPHNICVVILHSGDYALITHRPAFDKTVLTFCSIKLYLFNNPLIISVQPPYSGDYAFISEKSWYHSVSAVDAECEIAMMKEEFYPTSYGWALQKGSPFLEHFSDK